MNSVSAFLVEPDKRSKYYRMRFRLSGEKTWHQRSLKVRDKRTAQKLVSDFIAEAERESCGLLAPKRKRTTALAPLRQLVEEYLEDLRTQRRAEKYVTNTERQIRIPSEDCSWRSVSDINAEDFRNWRARNKSKAPRTLNLYLESLKVFLNWLVQNDRLDRNPLLQVGEIDSIGDIRRERRAATDQEITALLSAAPTGRRFIYIIALHTALRRGEIGSLTWGEVHLDQSPPVIVPRAEITKNKKSEPIFIHPELAEELRKAQPENCRPSDRVVKMFSRMDPMKNDLRKAGISFKDEYGRRLDFHALRHTANTRMGLNGVPLVLAQRQMRHSDAKLTAGRYMDASMSSIAKAVGKVPGFLKAPDSTKGSHVVSHDLVSNGLPLSHAGTDQQSEISTEPAELGAVGLGLAPPVAPCHNAENGSSGRIRTYDLVINSHPLYR